MRGARLIIGAAVLWGTTGTAQALGPAEATPIAVGAMRLIVGGAALATLAAVFGRHGLNAAAFKTPATWVAAGGIALYQPAFFSGVARTGIAVGTMVAIGSGPVFVGLLESAITKASPSRRWVSATATTIAGVSVLSLSGSDTEVDTAGVVLALGAGLAYATYAVAARRLAHTAPPVAHAGLVFGLAGLAAIPVAISSDLRWLAGTSGIASAAWLGLGATAAAYVLFSAGLAHTDARTASTLALAEPATATVLGVAVLGERPSASGWLGVALVAVGVAIAARSATGQTVSSYVGGTKPGS
jgi:DME family drug/metabolite transporter